ncbi:helix-turn-helix transcriptional regulator [Acidaminobacter sp. JC074]|uniref:helix-turn-helix transcriptional regulator n=1 Tax=Acidaminobacter sp. JC074 TaxID=2530199 RepID=UPI001F0E7CBD|nr:helix-turn-helix transcriptional regulator [Acidaminobacter sp. JC074]MCH4889487.1 helix-turn-helix transcriptional regulator [Acidaminobacter sp. JC074]
MNIKIGKNVLKYRVEQNVTQAQLADYLCISPQAVSKWEQEIAIPDVYLIPKIAFFFGVSIDYLFGVSTYEQVELLVDKYGVMKQEHLYKEALDSIKLLLDHEPEDAKVLYLLSRLDYYRGCDFIKKSIETSQIVMKHADKDSELYRFSKVNNMKRSALLGDHSFIEVMKNKFESEQSAEKFNDYVLALLTKYQYQEIMNLSHQYFDSFTESDQYIIAPNLMETAFSLNDYKSCKTFFDVICKSDDKAQIFSAWWIMWKMHKNQGRIDEERTCADMLRRLLPEQDINEYQSSRLLEQINKS